MSDQFLNVNRPENLPIQQMELSIGQCKLIYALLWAELSTCEDRTTIFTKNSLETLYDLFERQITPQKVSAYHA